MNEDRKRCAISMPDEMHANIMREGSRALTGRTFQDQVIILLTEALDARATKALRLAKRRAGL